MVNPTDPNRDPRFDTHLNPSSVIPSKPSATLLVLALTVGLVVLTLLGLLMFRGFMRPSPRSPERPAEQQLDHRPASPVSVTSLGPTLEPAQPMIQRFAR